MSHARLTAFRSVVLLCACGCYALLPTGRAGCVWAVESPNYSQYDSQIRPLVERMTLAEKIGQMTQADLASLGNLSDIQTYFLGSVLSGGDSDPQAGNSLAAWTDAYDRCQEKALGTRLGIPILYGVDAVHGHNNVLGAVIFPHNIALGCTRDPELVQEIGRITAEEVRASGRSGRLRRASRCRKTSAGDELTRASRKTRRCAVNWARRRFAACRAIN